MKVFISQPMGGLDPQEIQNNREEIVAYVKSTLKEKLGCSELEIVNSYIEEEASEEANISLWNLGESIKRLATADVIVFGRGYWKARGCLIEQMCAEKYGIWCDYMEDR